MFIAGVNYILSKVVKVRIGIRFCSNLKNMESPTITVKEGKLKGTVQPLIDGTKYYSFKGIPYAQPPIGNLRFKAPLPPQPWQGVLEATEHGASCPQFDLFNAGLLEGSEDCLFLNVYTKSLQSDSKLPVMVYIHGGGYMSGSGDTTVYGPEFLLQHDVLLVTINYRLEMLGFLCLDTPEVPGNAGLKDQVSALRWVQRNIKQFGGDPDNVTIFGESAGGASVTAHILSPMSKGLFHKGITQSGSVLMDWSLGVDGVDRAFRAGKYLGKETNDMNELLDFLLKEPAIKFAYMNARSMTTDEKHRGLPLTFVPVVEKKYDGVESFINEDYLDVLLSKKVNNVPLIAGYNTSEGMMSYANRIRKLDFINQHPEYLLPKEIACKVPAEILVEMGKRVKNFYGENKELTKDDAQKLTAMDGDLLFTYNLVRFVHFYADIAPVYMYRFNYVTQLNLLKSLFGHDLEGACHADDLYYLFYNGMNKDVYEQNEKLRDIVYKITKMWTDFAKFGNPTPVDKFGFTWKPYTTKSREYLKLEDQTVIDRDADKERVEFWNKLYKEAGRPHIHKSHL